MAKPRVRNFHLPLPEALYRRLRSQAAAAGQPATVVARHAIEAWLGQRRLTRLAQHYLKWRRLHDARCRFDVVSVTIGADGAPDVRHIPAAFDAAGDWEAL